MPSRCHAVLMFVLTLSLVAAPAVAQKKKKKPQPAPRWAQMDLGPTFTSTIGSVQKGIAIRVGAPGNEEAAVLFDTDLLRYDSGWTGGFVKIHAGRNALLGNDNIGGQALWKNARAAGAAGPNDAGFKDPRPKPYGPLPREWAKWRGHYMHGDQVVLSYTVGKNHLLELPGAIQADGLTVFTRTLQIKPAGGDVRLLVCEAGKATTDTIDGLQVTTVDRGGGKVTAVAAVGNAAIGIKHDDTAKAIVAHANVTKSSGGTASVGGKLFVWTGSKSDLPKFLALAKANKARQDLTELTKGGPKRWTKTVNTQGQLGQGDGPYVIDTITAPYENPYKSILHFGGADFLSDGRAAICTMEGDVWLVSGIDADLDKLTWTRYATGMYHPLGLKVVDDTIYVLCRDQITRLHDLNNDGEADFYENFNNDCQVGNHAHEFPTCLETDPAGDFFYIKGTNNGQTEHDSSVIRVSKDGKTFERFATGFRWPNGMGVSPDGTVTAADQQGTWVPSSRLDIVKRGGFYGYMNSHHRDEKPETYDGPLCWIPHKIDNSCGAQAWITNKNWGLPEGMMLHLSYGKCRLFLVLQEQVDGVDQGGVVAFPLKQPFISGAMRARFNPHDGHLYVSGLKGWQTSGVRDGCFQRVRYTGKKVHLPVGLNVKQDRIVLTFTQPLDKELAVDPESWSVERWNYRWTKGYGSKEYSVANPDKVGHDDMAVKSIKVSDDGKQVSLMLDNLKPVMQMMIQYDLESTDGEVLRGNVYHTVHRLGR